MAIDSLTIQRLTDSPGDISLLMRIFEDMESDPVRHFRPIPDDPSLVSTLLAKADKDAYMFATFGDQPVGLYTIRGLDEGYSEPMFGIYVFRKYRGLGAASLLMSHAELTCRIKGYQAILLKVDQDNKHAQTIYHKKGYLVLQDGDPVLMRKSLS